MSFISVYMCPALYVRIKWYSSMLVLDTVSSEVYLALWAWCRDSLYSINIPHSSLLSQVILQFILKPVLRKDRDENNMCHLLAEALRVSVFFYLSLSLAWCPWRPHVPDGVTSRWNSVSQMPSIFMCVGNEPALL